MSKKVYNVVAAWKEPHRCLFNAIASSPEEAKQKVIDALPHCPDLTIETVAETGEATDFALIEDELEGDDSKVIIFPGNTTVN